MFSTRTMKTLLMTLGLATLLGACAKESTSAPAARKAANPNAQPDSIVLGMGCFWGAEKRMAELPGVVDVESGYANGEVEGSYEAVLAQERALRFGMSNKRNHAEVVKVTYDTSQQGHPGEGADQVLGKPRPHPGRPSGQRRRQQLPQCGLYPPRAQLETLPTRPGMSTRPP
jgi:hypothetical protein